MKKIFMKSNLQIAQARLLDPFDLTQTHLEKLIGSTLSHSVDFSELFFQSSYYESWSLEDQIIKDAIYGVDQGCGVRVISGEKCGFAFTNDFTMPALQQAAIAARSIVKSGLNNQQPINLIQHTLPKNLYPAADPLKSIPETIKIQILSDLDKYTRALDPRIKQVFATLSASYTINLIANSENLLSGDLRPIVSINVSVIIEEHGNKQRASYGAGLRGDLTVFTDQKFLQGLAQEVTRQAQVALRAKPAPAGNMPVVIGAGWPGILLHEAVGHGLEGDFNRKGTSAYSNKIGQKVASELCTIIDDGTMMNRRGSLTIDDEGTPSGCNVLIENGILKGYMQDKLNAKLMKMQPTGNGRRESYNCLPMPRMTNTYMLAGKHSPEEIIASVKKGIYAVNFGGGQVDITSGKFVFDASEAYMIENGKITYPVKDATLIGNGPDVMRKVSMVGNDLKFDNGVGVCGKDGQSVPVGVGQPHLLIDEITVGGTVVC
jgi:TldD protein